MRGTGDLLDDRVGDVEIGEGINDTHYAVHKSQAATPRKHMHHTNTTQTHAPHQHHAHTCRQCTHFPRQMKKIELTSHGRKEEKERNSAKGRDGTGQDRTWWVVGDGRREKRRETRQCRTWWVGDGRCEKRRETETGPTLRSR